MKIIIIGCGSIGVSHLKSFVNSNGAYEVHIIDNHKRLKELKKQFISNKKLVFKFNPKIPVNECFDFAIIATNSLERYKAFKELIEKNKVKFILLEKFIFSRTIEYQKFDKFYKKYKKNIMINSFGNYLLKQCKIKKNDKEKINISVKVKEGTMFTGMIHYFDFFYLLTKKKFKINFSKIKKVINSKRLNYLEGLGEIYAFNSKGSIKISTSKKVNLEIRFKIKKNNYRLILINDKFKFFKDNKLNREFIFPFAYNTTVKLLENKKNFLKNYNYLSQISLNLLTSFKETYKKKLLIT